MLYHGRLAQSARAVSHRIQAVEKVQFQLLHLCLPVAKMIRFIGKAKKIIFVHKNLLSVKVMIYINYAI